MRDTFVQIFKDKPETSFNSDSSHNNEGQNGAVKDVSNNGWNNNHLSQIDGGMVKDSTTNYRGRSSETTASDPSGGKR